MWAPHDCCYIPTTAASKYSWFLNQTLAQVCLIKRPVFNAVTASGHATWRCLSSYVNAEMLLQSHDFFNDNNFILCLHLCLSVDCVPCVYRRPQSSEEASDIGVTNPQIKTRVADGCVDAGNGTLLLSKSNKYT